MSKEAKEQIRSRLDIADVVGEVVALKPSGRGQLKGLCPFHNEKTPSFHVHQDKGFYYCFGCQAKGDIFDFVMQTQGIDFYSALEFLGVRAGVEVTPSSPKEKSNRDLYELNSMALEFYKAQRKNHAHTHDYLLGRKLTEDSIDSFDLGYAPDSWDSFLKYALQKGISEHDLLAAGLIRQNDSGRSYDYFRNRIIFPIKDYLGRVVGFSGRVLDDSLPKYLNTAETDIFKKAELLYGLDVAKGQIRSSGECLIVEGYMDVIALHQTGFGNAVAALGATLTPEQAAQLSRLDVQKLYLAFDADAAGQRAILGGLEQSVGRQFLVKAIRVPHGKDPADAVLDGHIEEFRAALNQGLSEVAFRFQSVLAKYDKSSLEGKKNILNDLLPTLRPRDVFDPVASEMRRLVIDHLKVEPNRLDEWLNSKRQRRIDDTQVKGMQRKGHSQSQVTVIELEVIALLLLEPGKLKERLHYVEVALPAEVDDSVLREFHEICEKSEYKEQAILLHYRERDEARILFERLFQQPEAEEIRINIDDQIEKSLSRLRELYIDGEKENQRTSLLERMQEVSSYLTDPHLPTDKLQAYYRELKEINAMLAARDAERRMRVPASFSRQTKKKSGF
ncbi:MAG: DNA primase [Trueperaceae bacterium]|nr:DNA primase [Trueperaceae bacterium]